MYTLPDDINNDFLKGEIVKMICFNLNQIYIHFESAIQIMIEGQYSFENEKILEVYPVSSDNGFLGLIEKEVIGIEICNDRKNLKIKFEDGLSLKIISNDLYESYSIKIHDRLIIV